jgi:hypothetical protein
MKTIKPKSAKAVQIDLKWTGGHTKGKLEYPSSNEPGKRKKNKGEK